MKPKQKQRRSRLIRAGIQLICFIFFPSLFSTAFTGIKSMMIAISQGQSISWNAFLQVTVTLLAMTICFGRHFCGYMCSFGALGDAVYGIVLFIRQKIFKKKRHGLPVNVVHALQKVKYLLLIVILLICATGNSNKIQGTSPWDVFSMLTARRLPMASYKIGIILLILIIIGMGIQERFFCMFLCPMGAIFALLPIAPLALFKRNRQKCPPKCGLCKNRCPAHLDIDGDTPMSGECICCHACLKTCPRGNLSVMKESEEQP